MHMQQKLGDNSDFEDFKICLYPDITSRTSRNKQKITYNQFKVYRRLELLSGFPGCDRNHGLC